MDSDYSIGKMEETITLLCSSGSTPHNGMHNVMQGKVVVKLLSQHTCTCRLCNATTMECIDECPNEYDVRDGYCVAVSGGDCVCVLMMRVAGVPVKILKPSGCLLVVSL